METLDASEALLSNFEVLQLIKEHEVKQKQATKRKLANTNAVVSKPPQNLATIEFEVKKHLNDKLYDKPPPIKYLTMDGLSHLMVELGQFPLTKAEKLQIVNLRPSSVIELHVIIEACPERLTEEDVNNLIEIIKRCWPVPESPKQNDTETTTSVAMDTS